MSIGGGDGNGTVTNAGLLRKSNSAGTTSIGGGQGPSFSNSGTVDVAGGTLSFQLAFKQTAGTTLLSGGNLGGGVLFAYQGGELRGNGTITGGVSTGATVRPAGAALGALSVRTRKVREVRLLSSLGTIAGTQLTKSASPERSLDGASWPSSMTYTSQRGRC
jgi:hypothetical protein